MDGATSDGSSTPAREPLFGIAHAEASVNSDAFNVGLPKMCVLNVVKVGQTHTKGSAFSSFN
jgi:hypothetical protein